jgi:hypothetical protein
MFFSKTRLRYYNRKIRNKERITKARNCKNKTLDEVITYLGKRDQRYRKIFNKNRVSKIEVIATITLLSVSFYYIMIKGIFD